MSKIIKSQKMIKEGLWTIELMDGTVHHLFSDGTIIQCTNNDDFKLKCGHVWRKDYINGGKVCQVCMNVKEDKK